MEYALRRQIPVFLVAVVSGFSPAEANWVQRSTTSDPSGDLATFYSTLGPFRTPDDPVTVLDDTVTATVPKAVLGDLASAIFWGLTWDGATQATYDFTPIGAWAAGTPSSVADPTDGSFQPHQDLLGASVADTASEITVAATLRDLPFAGADRVQWSFDGPADRSAAINVYRSTVSGLYVAYAGPIVAWGGSFAWALAPYEDILTSVVDGASTTTPTLQMTLASPLPAAPAVTEAQPYFGWFFDADGACASGFDCIDSAVWVVWDPVGAEWITRVLAWEGTNFGVVPGALATVDVVGGSIEVAISGTDLGLTETYFWYSETGLVVGPVGGDWGLPLWGWWADWTGWINPHHVFSDGFDGGNANAWL